MIEIPQIIPSDFCLSCDVCCRFLQPNSPWRPIFTKQERDNHKNLSFDKDCKIQLVPHQGKYVCPCLTVKSHKCKIYGRHPFDCRLYPFLIYRKGANVFLGLDKKCPFIMKLLKERNNFDLIKKIRQRLTSTESIDWIKENSCVISVSDEETMELACLF